MARKSFALTLFLAAAAAASTVQLQSAQQIAENSGLHTLALKPVTPGKSPGLAITPGLAVESTTANEPEGKGGSSSGSVIYQQTNNPGWGSGGSGWSPAPSGWSPNVDVGWSPPVTPGWSEPETTTLAPETTTPAWSSPPTSAWTTPSTTTAAWSSPPSSAWTTPSTTTAAWSSPPTSAWTSTPSTTTAAWSSPPTSAWTSTPSTTTAAWSSPPTSAWTATPSTTTAAWSSPPTSAWTTPSTTTAAWSSPPTAGWESTSSTTTAAWSSPPTSAWTSPPTSSGWVHPPSDWYLGAVNLEMEGEAAVVGSGAAGAQHSSSSTVIGDGWNPATLDVITGSHATIAQLAEVEQYSHADPGSGEGSTVQLVGGSNLADAGEYYEGHLTGNVAVVQNEGSSFATGEGAIGLVGSTENESSHD